MFRLIAVSVFLFLTIPWVSAQSDGLQLVNGEWFVIEDGISKGPIFPNRLIVRRADKSDVTLEDLPAGFQVQITTPRVIGGLFGLKVSSTTGYDLYEALVADPTFDLVEFDAVVYFTGEVDQVESQNNKAGGVPLNPNDPIFLSENEAAFSAQGVQEAWALETGSSSIVIANIDSGVDIFHPDLIQNIWVNPGEDINGNGNPDFDAAPTGDLDGIDNDGNGFVDDIAGWNFEKNNNEVYDYTNNHGTLSAGLSSASSNNGIGVAGVAGGWAGVPGASLMVVEVEHYNSGNMEAHALAVLEAMEYAARNGADVVSVSFGWQYLNQAITEGLEALTEQFDILLCCAAGNSDCLSIKYPARYPFTLAVGKGLSSGVGTTSAYNKGPEMDVVAIFGLHSTNTDENDPYMTYGGTSSASPQVAGAVALMRSVDPSLSLEEAMFIIRAKAEKVIGMGDEFFTCEFGYGRLNVFGSVSEAMSPSIANNLNLTSYTGNLLDQAYQNISTGSAYTVPSGVRHTLQAGDTITLSNGFVATAGAEFRADVGYHEVCFSTSTFICESAESGNQAFFPFDESASDIFGHPVTEMGTINYESGNRYAAASFDGVDDAIHVEQILDPDPSSSFTLSAWVNITSDTGWKTIIGTQGSHAEIAVKNQQVRFGRNGGGGWWLVGPNLNLGQWYHIVGTYDGGQAWLYLDGQLVAGPIADNFSGNHGVSLIGTYSTNGGEWMKGLIDDAHIYNFAITQAEVETLYQSEFVTDEQALFNFENDFADASGKGHTGTGLGGVGYSTGYHGTGAVFDGVDDAVHLDQILDPDLDTSFSFSAWVKIQSDTGWKTIVGTDGSLAEIAVKHQTLRFGKNGSGSWWLSGPNLDVGTWYHVTGTYDGASAYLYLNGQLVAGPVANNFSTAHGISLIGSYSATGGEWMNGSLDDVHIYNWALPTDAVEALYLQSVSP